MPEVSQTPELVVPALTDEAPSGDGAPRDVPDEPAVCLNCDAPRLGDYCHACGQHHLDDRLTVRLLLREFARRFLKLERGLLHTTWRSLVAPGAMALAYISGKRRRFLNPLSYLLIASAVAVLLMPLYASPERMESDPFAAPTSGPEAEAQMDTGIAMGMRIAGGDPDELTDEQRAEVYAEAEAFMEDFLPTYIDTIGRLYSVFSVALVLVLAGLLKLFFSGRERTFTYAETLVLAAYVSGAYVLASAVLASAAAPFLNPSVASLVTLGAFLIFSAHATRGFYGRTWGVAGLGALVGALSLIAYLGIVVVVAFPIVLARIAL